MNIGVITTSYPRFAGDPAGNFVAAHVASLRALGHDVEVIAAEADEPLFYTGGAPDLLERGGVRSLAGALAFSARLTARVLRRAHAWDLAIAHWLAPSALAALLSRVPLLAIAHGGDIHTLARLHLLEPVLALLRLRGARLAFVSEPLRALANVRDAIVQPMGVDLEHFATLAPRPTSPPTLAVLARLVPIKGVDTAIAAMAHVTTRARLVIAGDGPERARLASPHAEFLGELVAPARDELLRRASVVIIPSRVLPNGRTEGTPLVALEALATGIPVIASRVGGLSDLPITLVAPDDPRALALAIDHVLGHPPHPDQLRASVASHGWPRVSERLLAHALIR